MRNNQKTPLYVYIGEFIACALFAVDSIADLGKLHRSLIRSLACSVT